MTSPSSATVGEKTEFDKRLAKAGLTVEIILAVNKDKTIAEAMIAAALAHPRFTLVHGLFTSAEDQIAHLELLNQERGWGFSSPDFAHARENIPAWPEGRLVALVLVPYFRPHVVGEKEVMSGVERTFQELWQLAAAQQYAEWHWDGYDNADQNRLRLLAGITHVPGLRWEVIDLGANRDRKPANVRSAETSPHAGILAAAMLHPEWVKATDSDKVPFVWIPGYEVNVSGYPEWQHVPNLRFDRADREVGLFYYWHDHSSSLCAVPTLVRASRE